MTVVTTAAPTVAFLVGSGASLTVGLVAAAATALAVFCWRAVRGERMRQAVIGLAMVAVCAGAAAITGQTRGFFLVPTLIPFAVIAVCLATIAAGRPLTGLVLNKVSGGPAQWRGIPRLRRVYTYSTWACIAVNVVNGVFQVAFYRANDPVVLGVLHIATGPVFAVIVAVTIACARRAMPKH
ncbi:DUF3159 domain-containing protein [Streptomyces sp. NPDC101237]|uniref:DUF3159 domain-containing protein n=1 Tax=Streptomyces sp. NPDC101237 TaxID=3366139 RepID=UPI0037F1592F